MQIDTFGAYVRAELDHWGREYALHRDCGYLGHQAKSLLAVLIEHKGDLPGRAQGYRPISSDQRAQTIEDIVVSIAFDHLPMACALRGYHCGTGRRKVERFDASLALMARCCQPPVSVRQYLTLVELGFQRVRGRLEGASMAA